MKRFMLAATSLLSTWCASVPERAAADGPGLTRKTYTAGTVIKKLDGGQRVTVWHRGYWYIPGRNNDVWDLSDADNPRLVKRTPSQASNTHDYVRIGDLFNRDYSMPELGNAQTLFLDLSKLPDIVPYLGADPAPGLPINGANSWEPYFYPHQQKLGRFDYSRAAGISASLRMMVGNILLLFPANGTQERGIASFDISNPDAPQLLDVITPPVGQYTTAHHLYKHHLLLVGEDNQLDDGTFQLVGIDFSDPRDLKLSYKLPEWPGRYIKFQDEFGFNAAFTRGWKYNFETNRRELEFHPPAGQLFSDFYWMPVGHLLLGSGDGEESWIVAHQGGLDTRAPFASYHLPRPNAVNQATTSRIAFVIHETLDTTTVNDSTIVVRPVGGAPIRGLVSVTDWDVVTFAPHQPLLPNTTYEVELIAGGIKDAAGNGMGRYTFRFSTGATIQGGAPSTATPTPLAATPTPTRTSTPVPPTPTRTPTATPVQPTATPVQPTPTRTATPTLPATSTPVVAPTMAPTTPPNSTPSGTSEELRVDCGSDRDTVDQLGRVWRADFGAVGGGLIDWRREGVPAVTGGDTSIVYHTERWGVERYRFPMRNGTYTVKLHFTEHYPGVDAATERVFDVNVEGRTISGIDVFAEAGRSNVLVRSEIIEVGDGELAIDFTVRTWFSMISGIEVIPVRNQPAPQPTPVGKLPPDELLREARELLLELIRLLEALVLNQRSVQEVRASGVSLLSDVETRAKECTADRGSARAAKRTVRALSGHRRTLEKIAQETAPRKRAALVKKLARDTRATAGIIQRFLRNSHTPRQ